eukprot:5371550-Prymnesium_polylepis.1
MHDESRQWSLTSRRAGPTGATLLMLARHGAEWVIVEQLLSAGPPPPFAADAPRAPTELERAAEVRRTHFCSCLPVQRRAGGPPA